MEITSIESDRVEVDGELFNFLKGNQGTLTTSDVPDVIDLYELISYWQFSGRATITFPRKRKNMMSDWSQFEYWLSDVSTYARIYDLGSGDEKYENEILFNEEITPEDYFGSYEAIKNKVVSHLLENEEFMANEGIQFVEIAHKGEVLYLIYRGCDCWALGHCNSVEVVSSWDVMPDLY